MSSAHLSYAERVDSDLDGQDGRALEMAEELLGMPVVPADAHDKGEKRPPETAREALEWSHVDALAFDDGVSYAMGLRCRPYKSDRTDLSLRVTPRSGDGQSEFDHVLRAMKTGGVFPRWYVFGLKTGSYVRETTGRAFRHLFIIDAMEMWKLLDVGDLDYSGPHESARGSPHDDSEALYIEIEDLRAAGCIEYEQHAREWDG